MLIKNLSFKFDKNSPDFFKDLGVEFEPNQVHFIQGDNGVGKSTLFNILQGKNESSSQLHASIELQGQTYQAQHNMLPSTFTNKVCTVQQNYDRMIASEFTFLQNLQLAKLPSYPGIKSLPEGTIFDVMHSLPAGIVNTPAHLLSGGQRQLLAILMALQKPTRILLLDEPTATLDKKNAQMIIQSLQHLAAELKVTMLIICHDRELVEKYAAGNYFVMEQAENGVREIKKV